MGQSRMEVAVELDVYGNVDVERWRVMGGRIGSTSRALRHSIHHVEWHSTVTLDSLASVDSSFTSGTMGGDRTSSAVIGTYYSLSLQRSVPSEPDFAVWRSRALVWVARRIWSGT